MKRFAVIFVITIPLGIVAARYQRQPTADCSFPLPASASVGAPAFENALYAFLENGCYRSWVHDPQIRNTGPFLDNKNFGTHPAVQVFYSPEVWDWVNRRARQGVVADGGMIVKEMFPSPAVQGSTLTGWTVMVKETAASADGWYWSYHAPGEAPDDPHDYPDSGFGLYCLRCHASAENELTFASVNNVTGNPLAFAVQVPTMPAMSPPADFHDRVAATTEPTKKPTNSAPDPDFQALYRLVRKEAFPRALPPEALDHVVARAGHPQMFVTSDQCLGCHSASSINMALMSADPAQPPVNLSPYTEWRASLMGLAGRDPVFHAQLESEKALHPGKDTFFDQTCYRCHGVMGRRQIELDGHGPFRHDMIYAQPGSPDAVYGALARDGVSCAACHHVSKDGLGTTANYTGQFNTGPADTLYGPYDTVATLPMKHALGITPKGAPQISASALCGSCHTIILPVFDRNGKKIKDIYEQTTYLEWRNSIYQNERAPIQTSDVKACHDCHMPRTYHDQQLAFRVANVEDGNYPATDHRASDDSLEAKPRDQYSRHMLMGINLFTLTMFRQFPELLGIRTLDYMYDAGIPGLATAQASSLELARKQTATIEVRSATQRGNAVDVGVRVVNQAGHGLPTGVEFRRAFIELQVVGADGTIRWASGRTSPLGVILDGTTDRPLRTEFMRDPSTGKTAFQPHYEIITREDQVQIYEELVANTEGQVTTSFVSLDHHVKENRLQPRGWRADGPDAQLTKPFGDAARDPDYRDGSGSDALIYRIPASAFAPGTTIRATLWYQALPPYYLQQRFESGKGPETDRLAWITSRLSLNGTPVEGWKLQISSATKAWSPQSGR